VFRQATFVAAAQRIALHVGLRQADDAQLHAARQPQAGGVAERQLHAAAADVDDDGARRADVHAIGRGHVNEPRLFLAGDDPRPDAGLALDAREELAAVRRFARGAGGRRQDGVDLVRVAMRLNVVSARRAPDVASAVSALPSRPPAPSRTIAFSRSTTSNERSSRTRTTIMWIELVPMSMAASRTTSL
jgi:hypothetical protein